MDNEKEQATDDQEEPEKKSEYAGYLVMLIIFGIFVGYIALEWFFMGPSPDCAFTDRGCQGDNTRWGQ